MDDRLKTIAEHYGLDSQLNILQEEEAANYGEQGSNQGEQ